MLSIFVIAITCLFNLLLGTFVLLRNPKQKSNISFSLISIFVTLWAVSNYITSTPSFGLTANRSFNHLAYLFALLAVVAGLLFTNSIALTKQRYNRGAVVTFVCTTVIVIVLSATSLVTGQVTRSPSGHLSFSVGMLLPLYISVMLAILILITRNLTQLAKRSHGREKQQALYILFGFAVPVLLGLLTNAVIPTFTSSWSAAGVGPLFTVLLVGSIGYAIVRHRLFDLRLAVARSLAYISSIVVVAFLYTAIIFILSDFIFGLNLGIKREALLALFSALVALLFGPLKFRFDRLTNSLFYRDAYDPQTFIGELNRVFVATTDLDKLLSDSANIIASYMKADNCVVDLKATKFRGRRIIGTLKQPPQVETSLALSLIGRQKKNVIVVDELPLEESKSKGMLEKSGIAILIRIASHDAGGTSLGYLVLGQKKSGNPYNDKDIAILNIISRELLIATQNALHYEEIQHFNLTLQQRVQEATVKLRQTNEKLRNLDQTKDDFISMASHQLRTPLTSVKGYVSMVLDGDAGPVNPLQRKLLNQSFASSQRMVYLIADLLNISRLKTGKFIIEPSPTNLAQITRDEISQLVETAKSRGLELTYDKPQNFPTYMLDTVKIRQVIMNFVDNAIYYTKSGGHIHVKLEDKPKSIELRVIDDGIGVPRNLQHHLFSKFYRAPNAQKARPDGTGLGLFMAKKVILAQGGAIIFDSTEGKGSVFGFSFAKSHLVEPPSK